MLMPSKLTLAPASEEHSRVKTPGLFSKKTDSCCRILTAMKKSFLNRIRRKRFPPPVAQSFPEKKSERVRDFQLAE
jgi:hypothetical protein